MKTIVLLILAFLAAMPAVHAQDATLSGKWTTETDSSTPNAGRGGGGGAGASSGGCFRGPIGQFPGQPCNDTGIRNPRPQPAQLDLSVDAKSGTVTGAIEFASVAILNTGSRCGRLKIEEGRITGRNLAFTTYKDVNGSRIPARWLGEITDQGGLVLRTFDTLPCETAPGGFSPLTGRSVLNSGSAAGNVVQVYRRGDGSKENGPAGKWWTTDSERVSALDLKVGSKGQLSGSVNVCGDSKVKIEEGAVTGRGISFTTYKKVGPTNVAQVWNGDIVNEGTLRLASPIAAPCRFASSTTLVFQRSK